MARSRRNSRTGPGFVLLVGFQDQDNLGLRYLMSSVNAAGHRAEIATYHSDPATLLARIERERPDVVGFSLIFQYMAPDFGRVIDGLRARGVAAHITMGGHYPSFDYREVLERIPGLDSIVRFEGENTLVELLDKLVKGENWSGIDGLAYRLDDGRITSNRLRDPIADLDSLPWPDRAAIDYESHPMPTASILGSRGCPWNCSFCSIRPFYEAQGGRLRRLRAPEAVFEEMLYLYRERDVPVFLFQDDDFLATGSRARDWACAIADLVIGHGLSGKIAFKMSCRSDEIRKDAIEHLIAGGLTHVYMGVESGDPGSLANMNKMLQPETHLEAGRLLKKLGLSFDFGFMLLDPQSTFDSVRNNIDFLEAFVGDGWSVAPFCRMLPYSGTPVRDRLANEGRLLGTPFEPDYRFLDPKLDLFYDWMLQTFYRRNFTTEGLCHILRALNFEARLRLGDRNKVRPEHRTYLAHVTALCNRLACYTLSQALDHIEETPLGELERDDGYLRRLTDHELAEEARLSSELTAYLNWVHGSDPQLPGPVQGGFDKSWTLAEGDREAAGVGAW